MAKTKTPLNDYANLPSDLIEDAYTMNADFIASANPITSNNLQKENEDEEIYFISPLPLPVEIVRQTGSFYPKDSNTKEISTDLMYKTEAYISDPKKIHPIFYNLYSTNLKPNGFYLATLSMSYFQGKFESVLRYTNVDKTQFDESLIALKENGKSAWDTQMQVEVHGNEPAGRGFNHEAYLLDPIRKRPVLMDCYNSDKLQSGIYNLTVDLERRKGKLMPINKYSFIQPHES